VSARRLALLAAAALLGPALGHAQADGPRLLDRIYFESGDATVPAAAEEIVAAAARVAAETPDCRVRLVGRADPRGCRWCNRRLSERRARATADALAGEGVGSARIEVVAHGERPSDDEPDLAALSEDERLARMRRVDVFLVCPDAP